jgi:hypothetical protein
MAQQDIDLMPEIVARSNEISIGRVREWVAQLKIITEYESTLLDQINEVVQQKAAAQT